MTARAVEAWTLAPLNDFVREVQARLVLLMTPAGQVLAQWGFARALDVMSAAALAAGIIASTGALAELMEQRPFAALNHEGERFGIYLSGFPTGRGPLVGLVVYARDVSSLGIVQLFFEQFVADLQEASPKEPATRQVLAADFEQDLTDSLNALFGR